ncbi:MAG: GNAT family N-acetyltransferase [Clostridiales bacterium]|nr:GNAT family N-acetyltransferase [Clostridiales bacterium]
MELRYVMPTDSATAISRVYEQSWKYAYNGIIPQDYLDAIPEGRWASKLDRPDRKTLVCTDNDKIVGTSSFGRSRLERLNDWGEVISIYLLPAYMGKGYGKILLERVVMELKKLGYTQIFLWVLEENGRARRFYERFGFTQTDDRLDDNIGGESLREIR